MCGPSGKALGSNLKPQSTTAPTGSVEIGDFRSGSEMLIKKSFHKGGITAFKRVVDGTRHE